MKKCSIFLTAIILTMPLSATACKGSDGSSAPSPALSGESPAVSSYIISYSTASDVSVASEAPEIIPNDEPTFLICPDGVPVCTSEISEVYSGREFDGNKETLTLTQAEQRARKCEGDFKVMCEGFAYGFIPQKALNRADDPDLFKGLGGETVFDYIGSEDELSTDCARIKIGDKFGTLTVKSACTVFSDDRFLNEFSEAAGAYFSGSTITFDGEVELTGYVTVWEDTDYEGAGGTMVFFPDGDSSVKIPVIPRSGTAHRRETDANGFYGDWWCSPGNISEISCDTSVLRKGDCFVKVKITAANVSSGQGGVHFELKALEVC